MYAADQDAGEEINVVPMEVLILGTNPNKIKPGNAIVVTPNPNPPPIIPDITPNKQLKNIV